MAVDRLGAFAIGSLLCALSSSVTALTAGRVLRGMGAGLGPLAVGLARDLAPQGRAPVWIGLLVAAAGSGAAIGLLLGGVLVESVSLAAVFWFMFAVALLLAVVAFVPGALAIVVGGWASGALVRATGARTLVSGGAVVARPHRRPGRTRGNRRDPHRRRDQLRQPRRASGASPHPD